MRIKELLWQETSSSFRSRVIWAQGCSARFSISTDKKKNPKERLVTLSINNGWSFETKHFDSFEEGMKYANQREKETILKYIEEE